jgi:hypothetical protein
MDVVDFLRNYAKEIGGQFSEYDSNKSIIVVPLDQGRFQTVIGSMIEENQRTTLEISSRICRYKQSIKLEELLIENANLVYSKFVILDDYLNMTASIGLKSVSPEVLREIVREVSEVADYWEQRLAGVDVH